jgi:hypothetical protein
MNKLMIPPVLTVLPSTPAIKAKTKLATAIADGVLIPTHALSTAAHKIENLPSQQAAIAAVSELRADENLNAFKLGGVLTVIRMKWKHPAYGQPQWFADCKTFDDVLDTLGVGHSRAYDLLALYQGLVSKDITWNEVKDIDCSKLILLCTDKHALAGTSSEFSERLEKVRGLTWRETVKYLADLNTPKIAPPAQAAPTQIAPLKVTPAPEPEQEPTSAECSYEPPPAVTAEKPPSKPIGPVALSAAQDQFVTLLKARLMADGPTKTAALLNLVFQPQGYFAVLTKIKGGG